MKHYPHYLGVTNFYNLDMACRTVAEAFKFGYGLYLVGSALRKPDYRDVDVRCILPDNEYHRLFPNAKTTPHSDPLWCLICTSISTWLSERTGLPIDFQIQMGSAANIQYSHPEYPRNAIGNLHNYGELEKPGRD